jgi:Sap, sulfolipid-1-addressing protein
MVLQAAGLAVLASISPTALLVAGLFLGSARPRLTATVYLVGAVVMSLVMGLVLLVVLRSADLNQASQHAPRYGFRLGLGVLLVSLALVLALRRLHRSRSERKQKGEDGLIYRLVAKPAPLQAFTVGILVFAPGAAFLAALQVIATARASFDLTVFALIVVVVLNVLMVWLPLLFYLAFPGLTVRRLSEFNGWLRVHGRTVLIWVLVAVGSIMMGNGLYGLV